MTRIGVAVSAAVLMMLGDVPAHSQSELQAVAQPETKMPRAARKHVRSAKIPLKSSSEFGGPLPGLTDEELDAFAEGVEEFQNEDSAESGLGPTFNDVSCAACHSDPAIGGSSIKFVTRFGREVDGLYIRLPTWADRCCRRKPSIRPCRSSCRTRLRSSFTGAPPRSSALA